MVAAVIAHLTLDDRFGSRPLADARAGKAGPGLIGSLFEVHVSLALAAAVLFVGVAGLYLRTRLTIA
jgi:hypothetical protein